VSTGTGRPAGRATAPGRASLVAGLASETRRLGDAAATFTQGVAERSGLAATDVQCLVYLADVGAAPSGRLAELTGLSPGATTRMIDRLEQAGYVRRAADPADRRLVRVTPVEERVATVVEHFAALARSLEAAGGGYSDEQLRAVATYLGRAVEVVDTEADRLREHAVGQAMPGSAFAAPVGGVTFGRLVFLSAVPSMTIRGDPGVKDLYRASFQGPIPRVRVREGAVTVRYARFAWFDWRARIGDAMIDTSVHWRNDRGEFVLNPAVPWSIELRGGGSRVQADLRQLELRSFELARGASRVELDLARAEGVVPIRLAGSLNEVVVRHPAGMPVRLGVSGATSRVEVDGQIIAGSGGNLSLASAGATAAAPDRYDIDVRGSANKVTVTIAVGQG
jgi:DNA-binding MarR family transcriptional regulator